MLKDDNIVRFDLAIKCLLRHKVDHTILKANDFGRLAVIPLDQWMFFLKESRLPKGANAPGLLEAAEVRKHPRLHPKTNRIRTYKQISYYQ